MPEIVSGAGELPITLNEVKIGASKQDQVAMKNPAMVEQLTGANDHLNKDATQPIHKVPRFRVSQGSTRSALERAKKGAVSLVWKFYFEMPSHFSELEMNHTVVMKVPSEPKLRLSMVFGVESEWQDPKGAFYAKCLRPRVTLKGGILNGSVHGSYRHVQPTG